MTTFRYLISEEVQATVTNVSLTRTQSDLFTMTDNLDYTRQFVEQEGGGAFPQAAGYGAEAAMGT